jgi:catechol 2,3-dioxygenase-like lactoylglutathione lyase family enzyme
MLGHLSIDVRDLDGAGRFYDPVLATIGWVRLWTEATGLGYGPPGGNDKLALFLNGDAYSPGPGFHLCFNAPSDAAVDACYASAVANGGIDNGAPGLRPHNGSDYYACFVIAPEGWKLEALHKASWD